MSVALGSPARVDAKFVAFLRVLRAHYSEDHIEVVLALAFMAPHADTHTKRLPAVAYRKGIIAGLSYDSTDAKYPECPYDGRQLPNFLSGDNDPRQAWRDGSRDGLRIRDIVLRPECHLVPELKHREFKVLTPELQSAHARRTASEA